MKKISLTKENEIIRLSKENVLCKEQVANKVGVTSKVITRIAKIHNLSFAAPKNSKTSKEVENNVIELFNNGNSVKYICEKFSLSVSTVNRILNRNNVIRHKRRTFNLTKKDINDICSLYKKGFSTVDIAKFYNNVIKNDNTIAKILKENNIDIRHSKRFSNIVNENFFENINTELKAYFLGFLYADGNVRYENKSAITQMSLKSDDSYILEKLYEEIGIYKKIKDFDNRKINYILKKPYKAKNRNQSVFCVTSEKIFNDLNDKGIYPNKTFNIEFPSFEIVPKYLMNHFIRGFFDGNGCIYKSNGFYRVVFYSQKNFLNDLKYFLINELNVNNNSIFSKENISMMTFGSKKDVKALYDYMYKDATLFLTRKKDKFNLD